MIFGRGGGGGIVNRALKRPTFIPSRTLTASADNWGDVRLTGDLDRPLGNGAGLRVNAMHETGESFRNHANLHRYGLNPTVAVMSGSTRIDLSYEHFHDRRTADRGVPADGNAPIRGFTRTFFGDPGISYAKADVDLGTLAIEHDFGSGLKLRNHTLLGDYRKFYQNVYGSGFNAATELVTLAGYNNRNDRTSLFSQTDLVWDKSVRRRRPDIVVRVRTRPRKFAQQAQHCPVPRWQHGADHRSNSRRRCHLCPSAKRCRQPRQGDPRSCLRAGPDPHLARVRNHRGVTLRQPEDRRGRFPCCRGRRVRSPRHVMVAAARRVAKPEKNLSFYASYSRSYLPQSGDQFSSLTDVTDGLKPERFDNYEVGAKWEILDGLLATAALYQLDRSNTRASDPLDPARTVLTGKQRSRGLELGLERSVTSRWMIAGGYSLQNAEITSTTSAAPAGQSAARAAPQLFAVEPV